MAGSKRVKVSGSGHGRRDRISDLPDHLLVDILVLLPFDEAVRTCVLSRRWRSVWTRLPMLDFGDDEAPRVEGFADLVAGIMRGYASDVDMPDVLISVRRRRTFADAVRVAASAFLAAQREISRFGFFVYGEAVNLEWDEEEEEHETPALQMPCFPTVKELALAFRGVDLRMPTTGTFARLTKMYFFGVHFSDDGNGISDVVTRSCPCLQDLELHTTEGLKELFLVSQSILSLRLIRILDLEQLVVIASELTEMQVVKCFALTTEPTSMVLSLPALEQLHWEDSSPGEIDYLSLPRQILKLSLIELPPSYLVLCEGGRSRFTRILHNFERIGTLHLEMPVAPDYAEQWVLIANINRPFFWDLELTVNKVAGHWFSLTILKLLSRCYWVTTLSLQIVADHREVENIVPSCDANCDCRTLQVWGDRRVGLDYLRQFAIKNFSGTADETYFICNIVANAKTLRKVSIEFSVGANPTEEFFHNLHRLAPSSCIVEYSSTN